VTGDAHGVFEDAALVLDRALEGDADAVADTFKEVAGKAGVSGVAAVAWCLASTIAGDGHHPSGLWSLDFPGIDEAPYDARWVARFVSAYLNEDMLTGQALVGAADSAGVLPECLLTLAGSTVATLRYRG
jgi:hypothetical protein